MNSSNSSSCNLLLEPASHQVSELLQPINQCSKSEHSSIYYSSNAEHQLYGFTINLKIPTHNLISQSSEIHRTSVHTVQSLQCTVQSICPFGPHSILFPFLAISLFSCTSQGVKSNTRARHLFSIASNLLSNSASANKYIFTLKLSTFGQSALCMLT